MNYKEQYVAKLGDLQGALDLIRSGDTIATPIYGNEPTQFLKQLHTIAPRVQDVTLWTMLMMGDYPVMYDHTLKGHIDIYTFFYNKDCRNGHDTGRFHMTPLDLHNVGRVVVGTKRPTVFVAAVSPMDDHGNVYLSFDLEATRECLEAADKVIFEINEHIPRVFGDTAIPYMKQQNSGSIVNISSVSSLVAQCGVTGYTAAKGGINALTRAAAVGYAPYFVRCNAVCPTTTVTPAVQKIFDATPGVEDALKAECVMPRLGKPGAVLAVPGFPCI